MRITEILESKYNESRHSIASLATDNYESSLVAVDSAIDEILKAYDKDRISPEKYIQQLEELHNVFLNSLDDKSMWDYVSDNLNDDDLTKLYQDFVKVENKLENTILQIKRDGNLYEDATDFKAANEQTSAMSTKRSKTKKDTA
jgi:hypothetical protein